jgi:hypothetical protein
MEETQLDLQTSLAALIWNLHEKFHTAWVPNAVNEVEAQEVAKGDGGCAGTDTGTVQTFYFNRQMSWAVCIPPPVWGRDGSYRTENTSPIGPLLLRIYSISYMFFSMFERWLLYDLQKRHKPDTVL